MEGEFAILLTKVAKSFQFVAIASKFLGGKCFCELFIPVAPYHVTQISEGDSALKLRSNLQIQQAPKLYDYQLTELKLLS